MSHYDIQFFILHTGLSGPFSWFSWIAIGTNWSVSFNMNIAIGAQIWKKKMKLD